MILHLDLLKYWTIIEYQLQDNKMNSEKLNQVLKLIQDGKSNEARKIFNEILPEETVEYLMVLGNLEQKFQNWAKAINAYSKILQIDPENFEAKNRIKMIQSILNFWNPEMFNP